jgi:hypothetical protein
MSAADENTYTSNRHACTGQETPGDPYYEPRTTSPVLRALTQDFIWHMLLPCRVFVTQSKRHELY